MTTKPYINNAAIREACKENIEALLSHAKRIEGSSWQWDAIKSEIKKLEQIINGTYNITK